MELNPGPGQTPVHFEDHCLSIFHGNIRSLRNKVDYTFCISNIIEDYDIVFITETHLDKLVLDKNIHFSGYDIPVRKDRNSDGGGIIMYYKTHVNIKRRVDLENPFVECMWFKLKTKLQNILINIIYRSERQSHRRFWDFFDAMLKNAMEESNHLICMGDLNKNFLNLPSNINDLISINGLFNAIHQPTHFDSRTGSSSLLDPILITDSDTMHIDISISDHDGTYITIRSGYSNSKSFKRLIWDYKKGDYNIMKQKSLEFDWDALIKREPDIDKACINFTNVILPVSEECIPRREVTIRCNDKIWFDSNIRREIRKRDRFRRKYLKLKTALSQTIFKQQRNRVNNLKKQLKEKFYTNINENLNELETINSKTYWKTINTLLKGESTMNDIPPIQDPKNNYCLSYEGKEKADVLNKYFCSITNLVDENQTLPDFDDRGGNVLETIWVREEEIIDKISILDSNKATGPDKISNKMIISIKNEIVKPLCLLFSKSLRLKKYPRSWKIAHVIPLFKNGDKSLPSNYRPVSLLSCVSKIFEKIVFKNIFNHLHKNKLLCKFQSGFIPGLSITHQLLEIYHTILTALDSKFFTSITFADVSKAFDPVWIITIKIRKIWH